MYIERVPNRNSSPAVLLRESRREGKSVKKRTLANLSKLPSDIVEGLRVLLRGGTAIESLKEAFDIIQSRPHGHVAAVLGTLHNIDLSGVIGGEGSREQALVLAMIVARIIDPRSKLATARGLGDETAWNSLAELLEVTSATEDDLYAAMDWLLERQPSIEEKLAKRHFTDGSLVLYDVTSTYFEGKNCPLAKRGYNRDKKKGKLQIVFGILCTAEGCPVAVEVFSGDTGDPSTLGKQIEKVRDRFGLSRVIWVGDRGLITEARIREGLRSVEGFGWITALRAPRIQELKKSGSLQLSLFDDRDLGEITDPAYPGERLIVCRNPFLTEDRRKNREDLLAATQKNLDKIVAATVRQNRPLRGKDKIALRVGKVLGRFKMAKHFILHIEENRFAYERDEEKIAGESSLDGIYIIRTSVKREVLETGEVVGVYKGLSVVEQAFRSFKSIDLKVRPIFHRLAERVRSHIFLCMLAYYVEWHMRKTLAPLLFDDEEPEEGKALRPSPVAPALKSASAKKKASTKRTKDDLPVHSFQTLLMDLSTITKNTVLPKFPEADSFEQITRATPLQQRALDLLNVRL